MNKGTTIFLRASLKQVDEITNLEKAYEAKLMGMTPKLNPLPSEPWW